MPHAGQANQQILGPAAYVLCKHSIAGTAGWLQECRQNSDCLQLDHVQSAPADASEMTERALCSMLARPTPDS